jgi:hypothetical protein
MCPPEGEILRRSSELSNKAVGINRGDGGAGTLANLIAVEPAATADATQATL